MSMFRKTKQDTLGAPVDQVLAAKVVAANEAQRKYHLSKELHEVYATLAETTGLKVKDREGANAARGRLSEHARAYISALEALLPR